MLSLILIFNYYMVLYCSVYKFALVTNRFYLNNDRSLTLLLYCSCLCCLSAYTMSFKIYNTCNLWFQKKSGVFNNLLSNLSRFYPFYALWLTCSQRLLNYLALQSFEQIWWSLFQKCVVQTKFDIYIFTEIVKK